MTERERILFHALKGIYELACESKLSAYVVLEGIRLTCDQTLREIAK